MAGRLAMPYRWSDLSVEQEATTVRYRGRRRSTAPDRRPGYDVALRFQPQRIERQTELDVFLTGRWHTYMKRGPFLGRFDIEHPTWPFHRAEFVGGCNDFLEAAGLPSPTGPPVAHYSPGVDVSIDWPAPVSSSSKTRELLSG
ncbi:MAG: DUF2071 domain-containing protein [Acidimicrobiia bacterium]